MRAPPSRARGARIAAARSVGVIARTAGNVDPGRWSPRCNTRLLMRAALILSLVAACEGWGGAIPDGLTCAWPTFHTEVITAGNAGYTTYRIGPDGAEHVLYRDDAKDTMMYGTRLDADATWAISPVPCRHVVSPAAARAIPHSGDQHLVVTPDNQVVVSCLREVLTRTDDGWRAEEIVPESIPGDPRSTVFDVDGTALEVGPDGVVHALAVVDVWRDASRRSLERMAVEHWALGESGWTREEIRSWRSGELERLDGLDMSLCAGPEGPRPGMSLPSCAVDVHELAEGGHYAAVAVNGDQTFVSYQANGALQLASLRGDILDHHTVAAGGVGSHTSIAIDREGRPHIAFRDDNDETLKLSVGRCD
jgi:hypothetical protein